MIQVSLEKLAQLLEKHGEHLGDHPDLAARAMVLNEQLAASPDVDLSFIRSMIIES